MNYNDIQKKVISILAKELSMDADKVTPDFLISEDLGADSLDIAEISMVIKEELGHDLSEEEIRGSKRVKDLVDILESALKK